MLDADVARRVESLTLLARRTVEGLLSGMHRSPHRGASVVFVEHREYRPGDDLRLLDWRAFARSDRHSIKRFEQESQLRAALVLDRSGSMDYGEGPAHKGDYAATLLAALAYVLIRQGDATGAMTFAEDVREIVPPRTRPLHLEALLRVLSTPVERDAKTRVGDVLASVAERVGRRGVVAIASDLLDLDGAALDPLRHLVSRGHDVLVFHVMHPDELELPFHGPVRVQGLEGEEPLDCDADALRAQYRAEVSLFVDSCRARCIANGARYRLARTDEPPERVLAAVLTEHGAGRWK